MTGILRVVMVAFTLFAVALIYVPASAWRNRRRLSSLVGFLASALLLTSSMLLGAITVGIHGYRAFTQEALAATIMTEPLGPQRFRATVTLPDKSLHMFDLAGDAVYVDAHVLKWRPIGTLLGLETIYELDRISGRYQALSDEQTHERTVYSLAANKRSEEHTSELQSRLHLVCRLLLEKKKKENDHTHHLET